MCSYDLLTGAQKVPAPARSATVRSKVGHGAMSIKANVRLAAVGSGATNDVCHAIANSFPPFGSIVLEVVLVTIGTITGR